MPSAVDSANSYLLLLPPAQSSELRSSYEKSILEVLEILAQKRQNENEGSVLDIAVACPHLVNADRATRQSLFADTQALVAAIYRLIVSVATRLSLDIETAAGEDIRVLLVAWSADSLTHVRSYGPIVSLEALAASKRPWITAFGDESEAGVAFLQAFYNARSHVQSDCAGCKATRNHPDGDQPAAAATAAQSRLQKVAVGGTFDHLHIGHKLLLTMTAFALDPPTARDAEATLIVGISSADLLKSKKHAEYLQPWTERAHAVLGFLRNIVDFHEDADLAGPLPAVTGSETSSTGVNGQVISHRFSGGLNVRCVEITDPYGPTITDATVDGLVLSGETRAGGQSITEKRIEKGWSPLRVMEVDVLESGESGQEKSLQDMHSKLSSTAIRERLAKAATARASE